MNAIDFLLQEHETVRTKLADINSNSHKPETKKKLFNELSDNLIRHEQMEHDVWYPNFKDNSKLDDTVKHLISEEKHAEQAIKKFKTVKDPDEWQKLFLKFKSDVEHHANEEETKLFPKIKALLSEEKLEELGKQMRQYKKEYQETH